MEHPGTWFWLADSAQPRRGAVRMKLAVMDVDARRDLHRQPWIDEHEAAGGGRHRLCNIQDTSIDSLTFLSLLLRAMDPTLALIQWPKHILACSVPPPSR